MTELFNMFTLDSDSTISINGEQTLGENIADFGGFSISYDLFVNKKIKEGFSGDNLIAQKKMFFQSFAIGWTSTHNDQIWIDYFININEHTPDPFRVNGNVCLMDDWYDLYDVQPGDKYYLAPDQRIVLW